MISLATKRYQSAASSVFAFSKTHDYVLTSFARQIHCEFKEICSLKHNSVLRSGHERMKIFSWEVVWEELNQMTPTLVKFLQKLFPKSNKMFLSCIYGVPFVSKFSVCDKKFTYLLLKMSKNQVICKSRTAIY